MPALIALLRSVNVGGHGQVAMSDLRKLFADLGLGDARTLLRTGNVVFQSGDGAGAELESLLEAEAAKRLDLQTSFFVRTADEWSQIVARNPFRAEAERDPGHLVAMALKDAPAEAAVAALRAAISGPERVHAEGRHLYVTYPAGIGRSRLTTARVEGKLGTPGTGRNCNTVLKLAALVQNPALSLRWRSGQEADFAFSPSRRAKG